jgi:carboxylesterase
VGEQAYERLSMASLLTMQAGILSLNLAAVTVPVLIVTSALDDVVDPASSDAVAASLGGPVQRVVLDQSGHVASLDVQRDELARAIVQFVAPSA